MPKKVLNIKNVEIFSYHKVIKIIGEKKKKKQ